MNNSSQKTTAGRPNYSVRKALPPNNVAAGSGMPPGSLPFNSVVRLTVEEEARAKAREEAMKRDEAKARAELSGIYVPRFRPKHPGKYTDEEEELEGPPVPRTRSSHGPDYDGFTEVRKKTRKTKRELNTAELNAKMMEPPSDDEDGEVNAELYDRARQHEHY
jgi:hypothetical protein